jgi:hypothetical protein
MDVSRFTVTEHELIFKLLRVFSKCWRYPEYSLSVR